MLSYRCHLQDVPSSGSLYTIQRALIYKEKSLLKKGRRGIILENCLLFRRYLLLYCSHIDGIYVKIQGHSAIDRATVSKTVGWGFESLCPCHIRPNSSAG